MLLNHWKNIIILIHMVGGSPAFVPPVFVGQILFIQDGGQLSANKTMNQMIEFFFLRKFEK